MTQWPEAHPRFWLVILRILNNIEHYWTGKRGGGFPRSIH